ncbi:MAG: phosphoenolpyruvate--protein phosphotransferase [Lachnospiraceae bacterium]|nr:phosphoenolpyruvate--protein phosphotransferase [Lachnospiraceae bacterium]
MKGTRRELSGIGVCDNIGIGSAVVIREEKPVYDRKSRLTPTEEKDRISQAWRAYQDQLTRMIGHARKNFSEVEADILEGQLILARDSSLSTQALEFISDGATAEYAVEKVCKKYIGSFMESGDFLLREKASDIRDIMTGMLVMIAGEGQIPLMDISDGSVIIGKELSPSFFSALYNKQISGIVTERGGVSGHAALIARSLHIPAVFSVPGIMRAVKNGDEIIVNGKEGSVFINPDDADREQTGKKLEELRSERERLLKYRDLSTMTADGVPCKVMSNIGTLDEGMEATVSGCEGIGLFRTEFFFQQSFEEPSEDEQYEVYRSVVAGMRDRDVAIRTLDIGGDKLLPYLAMSGRGRAVREKNPFLGLRGIRQSLANRENFMKQIRAILRAAVHGSVSMMLPLVTNLSELDETKKLIRQAAEELAAEGKPFRDDIPLGVMVETPSASLIARDIARNCDYISIGTNDLIQYVMCAERDNPGVEYLSSVFEPAVLRSIHSVIEAGHAEGIPVGICGEAGQEKKLIPLLLAWGIDAFSTNNSSVVSVRSEIARWTKKEAQEIAAPVLAMSTRREIEEHLDLYFGNGEKIRN